jgi:dihydrofolate reductase
MRKITVIDHVSLDGVMQAPARPDEDRRDGFEHGGWAVPYGDAVMTEFMAKGMAADGALLFGRRTYEDFAAVWPQRKGNPISTLLDKRQKYVASTTLREPLAWVNSTLLEGDAAQAVARLKEEPGDDLAVLGSGELVQSLVRHGLVDAYVLTIHPLLLGSGRRLFPDDGPRTALRLVESKTTTTGVIIAVYEPVEPAE